MRQQEAEAAASLFSRVLLFREREALSLLSSSCSPLGVVSAFAVSHMH
jgi:hypothetical protein